LLSFDLLFHNFIVFPNLSQLVTVEFSFLMKVELFSSVKALSKSLI
jgi:hypothetical protein